MDDTISRQGAIDALIDALNGVGVLDAEDINTVFQMLPPAQPEIIRCKDCKHYKEWESEFTPNAVVTQCMADNFPIRKAIPDGWFCAGAERRTDEE